MDENWFYLGVLIGFILGFLFSIMIVFSSTQLSSDNYKQGQIDAYNKVIHYRLTKVNNETIWKYYKEAKNVWIEE